jgi:integrase
VRDAIGEYLEDLAARELRATTLESTGCRLRTFFAVGAGTGGPIADVTKARAAHLLEGTRHRTRVVKVRGGHQGKTIKGTRAKVAPRSVTYRAGMLAEVGTFARWCVTKGYLQADPTKGLEVEGRRKRGKFQLRIDEALQWEQVALAAAAGGDRPALAAVLCLLLGCRASEVTQREARDFDLGGTVLWIPDAKTDAGRRRVEVPAHVVELVRAAKRGLDPFARVFDELDRHQLLRVVHRLCRVAKVSRVCTQSLRGLHGTLATEQGATGHLVAAALGHADQGRTAERHYTSPAATDRARQGRALKVLAGGRS